MNNKKIVLGLSGGVDSAVAASILKEQGYEVIGVFLDFGLVTPDDARKLSEDIGIEFHALKLADKLEENVCSYFREEYNKGRTPNPCIVCNPKVKFRSLVDFADSIGVKHIATGHYATVRHEEDASYIIRTDSPKDQSYMLYRLPQEIVSRIIFPLTNFTFKDEVRAEARKRNLFVESKPDSMEICFVPNDDHGAYIESFGTRPPAGDFIDKDGNVLGKHLGIHRYTVGQRKGLNVSSTGRLYVHKINPSDNTIVLGLEDLFEDKISISDVCYIKEEYRNMDSFRAEVKVRYSKNQTSATIFPKDTHALIEFDTPVRAPARGQSAVFYIGDKVIGGGFID